MSKRLLGSVVGACLVAGAVSAAAWAASPKPQSTAGTARVVGEPTLRIAKVTGPKGTSGAERADSARRACIGAFSADHDARLTLAVAATFADLDGWKYAPDTSRSSKLNGRKAADVVALCWVDGDFDPKEPGPERAVYFIGDDGIASLLAVGDLADIAVGPPALKNVPPPPVGVKNGARRLTPVASPPKGASLGVVDPQGRATNRKRDDEPQPTVAVELVEDPDASTVDEFDAQARQQPVNVATPAAQLRPTTTVVAVVATTATTTPKSR